MYKPKMTSKLNPNAKEFIPLQDQIVQIHKPKKHFRQVCQFAYKDYLFDIEWDEEKKRAILYGNIKYTWQFPDMTIRDIINWWCDCPIEFHVFKVGNKLALDTLVSKATVCCFNVEDIRGENVLECGCCDTCHCSKL